MTCPEFMRRALRNRTFGATAEQKNLVINVCWTGESYDQELFSDEIAKKVLEGDRNATQHDFLEIIVSRGHNLGVASAHVSEAFQRTPAEWRERLGLSEPAKASGIQP
jgi:hypothetical protein